jgi:hypothetical protein
MWAELKRIIKPNGAAIGRQISDMRAELGRVLDALNVQDAAEAEVRLDEALSYAATLLMWREAIK